MELPESTYAARPLERTMSEVYDELLTKMRPFSGPLNMRDFGSEELVAAALARINFRTVELAVERMAVAQLMRAAMMAEN